MKTCTTCLQVKPLDEFYVLGISKTAKTKDGRYGECKVCNRTRAREWQRRMRATDPRQAVSASIRSRHGITLDQYEELLASQGGRCAICGTTEPGGRGTRFAIDHDHACCPDTGSCGKCVRALLCSGCNTGLGQFGDDVDRMLAAVAYLLSRQNVLGRL